MEYKQPTVPFTECYKKLVIAGEFEEILDKLISYSYGIDKETREMEIHLTLSKLHRAQGLLALKNEIASLYNLSRCDIV
ncbi:MAG: hypothetical protein IJF24_01965, partial [Clostridia bacterium]|nr:hypothetical protein [Clostridia bacterium]